MLIGAIIGLFLVIGWTWLNLRNLYKYRRDMIALGYKVNSVTIHYPVMVVRITFFTLLGAIIGYFVA